MLSLIANPSLKENYNTPLIYEPGDSWAYGPSIDWAGRVVSRSPSKRFYQSSQ